MSSATNASKLRQYAYEFSELENELLSDQSDYPALLPFEVSRSLSVPLFSSLSQTAPPSTSGLSSTGLDTRFPNVPNGHLESVPNPLRAGTTIRRPIERSFHCIQKTPTSHSAYAGEPRPRNRANEPGTSPWGEQTCVPLCHDAPFGYQNRPLQFAYNYSASATTSTDFMPWKCDSQWSVPDYEDASSEKLGCDNDYSPPLPY
jgi:hypothetical protein